MPLNEIDSLIRNTVFAATAEIREKNHHRIRELAVGRGIFPASIHGLYAAAGRGAYHNRTVPAINIRGITYDVARAVFRAAIKDRVGALIFEIARSEIGYTDQRPAEYAACVMAAAIREGFTGPLFIQGDHFQMNREKYAADPAAELNAVRELIREAIHASFLNIDVDASTLVDISRPSLEEQQQANCLVMADLTRFIRGNQPAGIKIAIGGEIGEVGGRNSTVEDLRAFMSSYLKRLPPGFDGISKISVQTGTRHGGTVLPDGRLAAVEIDFKVLEAISRVAREEYGLAGAVQHGASTLPDEDFDFFPKVGAAEVHLATGFQNLILDSPDFPDALRQKINRHILQKYAGERAPGDTDEQLIYKTRKKSFGDFKQEMWALPEANLARLGATLEERFALLFRKLNVVDTVELVNRFVAAPQTSVRPG